MAIPGCMAMLKVQYPHECHVNAGKVSSSAKFSVTEDVLRFVDSNSQPNGRSVGSHGAISQQ